MAVSASDVSFAKKSSMLGTDDATVRNILAS